MEKELNPIGYEELIINCFSSKTLKTAKIGKIKWGPYIAQLVWDVKGTPFGDQVIWLFFSPRSMKPIDRLLQQIINLAKRTDRKLVVINGNFAPNQWYAHEVLILSDGHITCNAMSLTLKDGSIGYIGYIVGQGRQFDFDDRDINGALHTIVSNLFNNKKLKNNPFIKAGLVKLDKVREKMTEHGTPMGYYSPRTGKIQRVSKSNEKEV